LEVGAIFAALAGAFVGGDAKSFEAVVDLIYGAFDQAAAVGVFDAQHKGAIGVAGPEPVEEAGADAADVQMAGGAGGEADAGWVLGA